MEERQLEYQPEYETGYTEMYDQQEEGETTPTTTDKKEVTASIGLTA